MSQRHARPVPKTPGGQGGVTVGTVRTTSKGRAHRWADHLRFLSPGTRNCLGLPTLSLSFYPPFLLLQAQKPSLVFLLSVQKGEFMGDEGCPRQEGKAEVIGRPLSSVSQAMSGCIAQVPLSLTISYSCEKILAPTSALCWVLLQWHAHPG